MGKLLQQETQQNIKIENLSINKNNNETKEKSNRSDFIEKNMGLVHLIAHKFTGRGIEYDDLFQAGCIGLIKASDGFDSQRGVMFSTYAVPVIMGEIKRLFRDGGSVKVSRSIKELSVKIVKAKSSLSIKLGREPQISELATELEVTAEQITEAVAASQAVCSLTDNSDDSKNQIDVPTEGHEFSLTNKIAIEQALKQLVGKDRDLIFLRFVLNKTQSETATALSMTQVQISRREKKILEILRKYLC